MSIETLNKPTNQPKTPSPEQDQSEMKNSITSIKEALNKSTFTKIDLLGEMQNGAKKPYGFESYLDKHWDDSTPKEAVISYLKLVVKTKKLSKEKKQQTVDDLLDLITTTQRPLDKKKTQRTETGYEGTSRLIATKLDELDNEWEDSVTRLHSLLLSGVFYDNEITEDLKTSLSFQRKSYKTLKDLYMKSRMRMILSGRDDNAKKLDGFMLGFLQKFNKGLNPKEYADLTEERKRYNGLKDMVEGTISDLEKFSVSVKQERLSDLELSYLQNFIGIIDKNLKVRDAYKKLAKNLYTGKRRNELQAVNNVMEGYIDFNTPQNRNNEYLKLSKHELEIKKEHLMDYLSTLDDQDSAIIQSYQESIVNQDQYFELKRKRKEALKNYTLEQIKLVEDALEAKNNN